VKEIKKLDSRIPLIEPFLQNPDIVGHAGEPLEHLTKIILAFTLAQVNISIFI
jgi:hypothetical protein